MEPIKSIKTELITKTIKENIEKHKVDFIITTSIFYLRLRSSFSNIHLKNNNSFKFLNFRLLLNSDLIIPAVEKPLSVAVEVGFIVKSPLYKIFN